MVQNGDQLTSGAGTVIGPVSDLGRVGLAAGTAFLLVVLLCPFIIRLFRRLGIVEYCNKSDSREIADRHGPKKGTATMGGLVLIVAVLAAATVWTCPDGVLMPSLIGVLVLFGAVGAMDDVIKIRHPVRKGLGRRVKFLLLGAVALMAATVVYAHQMVQSADAGIVLQIPVAGWMVPIGPFFMVLAIVVLTGSANAVNLTDGLDGLAPGLLVLSFGAFTVLAFIAGAIDRAADYHVLFVSGACEVAVFASALTGAMMGFLVFNRHPARIFMGDTGALAMGGALGMVALLIRQELLLMFVGGVFVVEAVSVIVQVWYFRRCGERIFRCAPLHHHFEFKNWPESRITRSFWLAGAALSAVAILGTLGGG